MSKNNPKIVKKPLTTIQKRATKRSLWVIALFALLMSGFIALAREVRDAETMKLDTAVLHEVHELSHAMLDAPIIWLTNLGGPSVVPVITAVIVIMLFMMRRNTAALKIALSVGGAGIINLILKSFFGRTRPELWDRLVTEHSFSFPSGHAMASTALAASVIAVTWGTRWRYWMITLGLGYMLTIGFTRLYLGVHYPTDIIAGWMVAIAWVSLINWIFSRTRKQQKAAKKGHESTSSSN